MERNGTARAALSTIARARFIIDIVETARVHPRHDWTRGKAGGGMVYKENSGSEKHCANMFRCGWSATTTPLLMTNYYIVTTRIICARNEYSGHIYTVSVMHSIYEMPQLQLGRARDIRNTFGHVTYI